MRKEGEKSYRELGLRDIGEWKWEAGWCRKGEGSRGEGWERGNGDRIQMVKHRCGTIGWKVRQELDGERGWGRVM